MPVLLGVLLIGFLLLQVVPTDPATVSAGPTATKADVEAIRQQMGLDQPLWLQFVLYLGARAAARPRPLDDLQRASVARRSALTLWPDASS